MNKKAAFITIHGMGDTPENYYQEIHDELKHRLGSKFDELHFGHVYYQKILQDNERYVWNRVAKRVRWDALRQFLLFGFGDAAGLENGKEARDSVYSQAQQLIAKELLAARKAMGGDGAVVILAQSLGGHVASCYFWDAKQYAAGGKPKVGIWQDIGYLQQQVNGGVALTPEELSFIQGESLRFLYTTGCNIPIFVAAHRSKDILPISPNDKLEWHNFYDKDDVLGWPLAELSKEYEAAVRDHAVNAGGGIMGWIFKSWNPLSHEQYWGDDEILDPLENHLRQLISKV